ncbi:MAG: GNAT family N-acetyltransferase [Actinomycetia bacterium]|nr:GNAT family N-acetyltransferase [Actinomycetes bacterium]MCP4224798.1 GNAT family N-acetyltransferase [Actinomycetes bacterium]MCP5033450.1 GNAT family N-acetyltransferase [Actinomycetes bacterium]
MEGARLAVPTDVGSVSSIAERASIEFQQVRGGAMVLARELAGPPIDVQLLRAIDDGAALAVVGGYDEVVFGYGLATFDRLTEGRLIVVVSHLVVDAEARGVGIGGTMMSLILDEARAIGCTGIDSVALPGDRSTKSFFESFGLKTRLLTVHCHLDP